MSIKMFLLVTLFFSNSALAGGQLFMRGEYQNFLQKATGSADQNHSTMVPSVMLLDINGQQDDIEYKFVLNFAATLPEDPTVNTAASKKALIWGDVIDEAWAATRFEHLRIVLGKQPILAGGWENTYKAPGLTYHLSLLNDDGLVTLPGNYLTLGAELSFGDHTLVLSAGNDTGTTGANTRRHSLAALYKAGFMDKNLNILAGHSGFAQESTSGSLISSNFGLQYLGFKNLSLPVNPLIKDT